MLKDSVRENDQRFEETQSLIKKGSTVRDAVEKTGIPISTYYKSLKKKNPQKRAYKKRKPSFIDLPLKPAASIKSGKARSQNDRDVGHRFA